MVSSISPPTHSINSTLYIDSHDPTSQYSLLNLIYLSCLHDYSTLSHLYTILQAIDTAYPPLPLLTSQNTEEITLGWDQYIQKLIDLYVCLGYDLNYQDSSFTSRPTLLHGMSITMALIYTKKYNVILSFFELREIYPKSSHNHCVDPNHFISQQNLAEKIIWQHYHPFYTNYNIINFLFTPYDHCFDANTLKLLDLFLLLKPPTGYEITHNFTSIQHIEIPINSHVFYNFFEYISNIEISPIYHAIWDVLWTTNRYAIDINAIAMFFSKYEHFDMSLYLLFAQVRNSTSFFIDGSSPVDDPDLLPVIPQIPQNSHEKEQNILNLLPNITDNPPTTKHLTQSDIIKYFQDRQNSLQSNETLTKYKQSLLTYYDIFYDIFSTHLYSSNSILRHQTLYIAITACLLSSALPSTTTALHIHHTPPHLLRHTLRHTLPHLSSLSTLPLFSALLSLAPQEFLNHIYNPTYYPIYYNSPHATEWMKFGQLSYLFNGINDQYSFFTNIDQDHNDIVKKYYHYSGRNYNPARPVLNDTSVVRIDANTGKVNDTTDYTHIHNDPSQDRPFASLFQHGYVDGIGDVNNNRLFEEHFLRSGTDKRIRPEFTIMTIYDVLFIFNKGCLSYNLIQVMELLFKYGVVINVTYNLITLIFSSANTQLSPHIALLLYHNIYIGKVTPRDVLVQNDGNTPQFYHSFIDKSRELYQLSLQKHDHNLTKTDAERLSDLEEKRALFEIMHDIILQDILIKIYLILLQHIHTSFKREYDTLTETQKLAQNYTQFISTDPQEDIITFLPKPLKPLSSPSSTTNASSPSTTTLFLKGTKPEPLAGDEANYKALLFPHQPPQNITKSLYQSDLLLFSYQIELLSYVLITSNVISSEFIFYFLTYYTNNLMLQYDEPLSKVLDYTPNRDDSVKNDKYTLQNTPQYYNYSNTAVIQRFITVITVPIPEANNEFTHFNPLSPLHHRTRVLPEAYTKANGGVTSSIDSNKYNESHNCPNITSEISMERQHAVTTEILHSHPLFNSFSHMSLFITLLVNISRLAITHHKIGNILLLIDYFFLVFHQYNLPIDLLHYKLLKNYLSINTTSSNIEHTSQKQPHYLKKVYNYNVLSNILVFYNYYKINSNIYNYTIMQLTINPSFYHNHITYLHSQRAANSNDNALSKKYSHKLSTTFAQYKSTFYIIQKLWSFFATTRFVDAFTLGCLFNYNIRYPDLIKLLQNVYDLEVLYPRFNGFSYFSSLKYHHNRNFMTPTIEGSVNQHYHYISIPYFKMQTLDTFDDILTLRQRNHNAYLSLIVTPQNLLTNIFINGYYTLNFKQYYFHHANSILTDPFYMTEAVHATNGGSSISMSGVPLYITSHKSGNLYSFKLWQLLRFFEQYQYDYYKFHFEKIAPVQYNKIMQFNTNSDTGSNISRTSSNINMVSADIITINPNNMSHSYNINYYNTALFQYNMHVINAKDDISSALCTIPSLNNDNERIFSINNNLDSHKIRILPINIEPSDFYDIVALFNNESELNRYIFPTIPIIQKINNSLNNTHINSIVDLIEILQYYNYYNNRSIYPMLLPFGIIFQLMQHPLFIFEDKPGKLFQTDENNPHQNISDYVQQFVFMVMIKTQQYCADFMPYYNASLMYANSGDNNYTRWLQGKNNLNKTNTWFKLVNTHYFHNLMSLNCSYHYNFVAPGFLSYNQCYTPQSTSSGTIITPFTLLNHKYDSTAHECYNFDASEYYQSTLTRSYLHTTINAISTSHIYNTSSLTPFGFITAHPFYIYNHNPELYDTVESVWNDTIYNKTRENYVLQAGCLQHENSKLNSFDTPKVIQSTDIFNPDISVAGHHANLFHDDYGLLCAQEQVLLPPFMARMKFYDKYSHFFSSIKLDDDTETIQSMICNHNGAKSDLSLSSTACETDFNDDTLHVTNLDFVRRYYRHKYCESSLQPAQNQSILQQFTGYLFSKFTTPRKHYYHVPYLPNHRRLFVESIPAKSAFFFNNIAHFLSKPYPTYHFYRSTVYDLLILQHFYPLLLSYNHFYTDIVTKLIQSISQRTSMISEVLIKNAHNILVNYNFLSQALFEQAFTILLIGLAPSNHIIRINTIMFILHLYSIQYKLFSLFTSPLYALLDPIVDNLIKNHQNDPHSTRVELEQSLITNIVPYSSYNPIPEPKSSVTVSSKINTRKKGPQITQITQEKNASDLNDTPEIFAAIVTFTELSPYLLNPVGCISINTFPLIHHCVLRRRTTTTPLDLHKFENTTIHLPANADDLPPNQGYALNTANTRHNIKLSTPLLNTPPASWLPVANDYFLFNSFSFYVLEMIKVHPIFHRVFQLCHIHIPRPYTVYQPLCTAGQLYDSVQPLYRPLHVSYATLEGVNHSQSPIASRYDKLMEAHNNAKASKNGSSSASNTSIETNSLISSNYDDYIINNNTAVKPAATYFSPISLTQQFIFDYHATIPTLLTATTRMRVLESSFPSAATSHNSLPEAIIIPTYMKTLTALKDLRPVLFPTHTSSDTTIVAPIQNYVDQVEPFNDHDARNSIDFHLHGDPWYYHANGGLMLHQQSLIKTRNACFPGSFTPDLATIPAKVTDIPHWTPHIPSSFSQQAMEYLAPLSSRHTMIYLNNITHAALYAYIILYNERMNVNYITSEENRRYNQIVGNSMFNQYDYYQHSQQHHVKLQQNFQDFIINYYHDNIVNYFGQKQINTCNDIDRSVSFTKSILTFILNQGNVNLASHTNIDDHLKPLYTHIPVVNYAKYARSPTGNLFHTVMALLQDVMYNGKIHQVIESQSSIPLYFYDEFAQLLNPSFSEDLTQTNKFPYPTNPHITSPYLQPLYTSLKLCNPDGILQAKDDDYQNFTLLNRSTSIILNRIVQLIFDEQQANLQTIHAVEEAHKSRYTIAANAEQERYSKEMDQFHKSLETFQTEDEQVSSSNNSEFIADEKTDIPITQKSPPLSPHNNQTLPSKPLAMPLILTDDNSKYTLSPKNIMNYYFKYNIPTFFHSYHYVTPFQLRTPLETADTRAQTAQQSTTVATSSRSTPRSNVATHPSLISSKTKNVHTASIGGSDECYSHITHSFTYPAAATSNGLIWTLTLPIKHFALTSYHIFGLINDYRRVGDGPGDGIPVRAAKGHLCEDQHYVAPQLPALFRFLITPIQDGRGVGDQGVQVPLHNSYLTSFVLKLCKPYEISTFQKEKMERDSSIKNDFVVLFPFFFFYSTLLPQVPLTWFNKTLHIAPQNSLQSVSTRRAKLLGILKLPEIQTTLQVLTQKKLKSFRQKSIFINPRGMNMEEIMPDNPDDSDSNPFDSDSDDDVDHAVENGKRGPTGIDFSSIELNFIGFLIQLYLSQTTAVSNIHAITHVNGSIVNQYSNPNDVWNILTLHNYNFNHLSSNGVDEYGTMINHRVVIDCNNPLILHMLFYYAQQRGENYQIFQQFQTKQLQLLRTPIPSKSSLSQNNRAQHQFIQVNPPHTNIVMIYNKSYFFDLLESLSNIYDRMLQQHFAQVQTSANLIDIDGVSSHNFSPPFLPRLSYQHHINFNQSISNSKSKNSKVNDNPESLYPQVYNFWQSVLDLLLLTLQSSNTSINYSTLLDAIINILHFIFKSTSLLPYHLIINTYLITLLNTLIKSPLLVQYPTKCYHIAMLFAQNPAISTSLVPLSTFEIYNQSHSILDWILTSLIHPNKSAIDTVIARHSEYLKKCRALNQTPNSWSSLNLPRLFSPSYSHPTIRSKLPVFSISGGSPQTCTTQLVYNYSKYRPRQPHGAVANFHVHTLPHSYTTAAAYQYDYLLIDQKLIYDNKFRKLCEREKETDENKWPDVKRKTFFHQVLYEKTHNSDISRDNTSLQYLLSIINNTDGGATVHTGTKRQYNMFASINYQVILIIMKLFSHGTMPCSVHSVERIYLEQCSVLFNTDLNNLAQFISFEATPTINTDSISNVLPITTTITNITPSIDDDIADYYTVDSHVDEDDDEIFALQKELENNLKQYQDPELYSQNGVLSHLTEDKSVSMTHGSIQIASPVCEMIYIDQIESEIVQYFVEHFIKPLTNTCYFESSYSNSIHPCTSNLGLFHGNISLYEFALIYAFYTTIYFPPLLSQYPYRLTQFYDASQSNISNLDHEHQQEPQLFYNYYHYTPREVHMLIKAYHPTNVSTYPMTFPTKITESKTENNQTTKTINITRHLVPLNIKYTESTFFQANYYFPYANHATTALHAMLLHPSESLKEHIFGPHYKLILNNLTTDEKKELYHCNLSTFFDGSVKSLRYKLFFEPYRLRVIGLLQNTSHSVIDITAESQVELITFNPCVDFLYFDNYFNDICLHNNYSQTPNSTAPECIYPSQNLHPNTTCIDVDSSPFLPTITIISDDDVQINGAELVDDDNNPMTLPSGYKVNITSHYHLPAPGDAIRSISLAWYFFNSLNNPSVDDISVLINGITNPYFDPFFAQHHNGFYDNQDESEVSSQVCTPESQRKDNNSISNITSLEYLLTPLNLQTPHPVTQQTLLMFAVLRHWDEQVLRVIVNHVGITTVFSHYDHLGRNCYYYIIKSGVREYAAQFVSWIVDQYQQFYSEYSPIFGKLQ